MSQSSILLEQHRAAIAGHCYRMLGSATDADDAVQETMVRAWKHEGGFEGRSAVRSWLYKIATNVCLDLLRERKRRARPMEEGAAVEGNTTPTVAMLHKLPREHWLEPIADADAIPADGDPKELLILRQSIRLAFVSALQHLPPKQRAALILSDVLDWSASEIAESLNISVAAANSALQRARATMAARDLPNFEPLSSVQSRLLEQYVAAFERYDVDALTAMLRHDATFSMPPYALWMRGPKPVHKWLSGPGLGCKGSRLLRAEACGSPAFAQYRRTDDGEHVAWALVVLELSGDAIVGWNSFLDVELLFPRFGLPLRLAAADEQKYDIAPA